MREEFARIFREHYPAVLAYVRRRTPAGGAEDLAAEVFGRAWKNFATLRGEPLPWLYGIARNVVLESYRSPQLAEFEDQPEADFSQSVDLNLDINRALATLSETEREILTLHAWEGLDAREIAAVLDISYANARVRLHRARTHLKEAMS